MPKVKDPEERVRKIIRELGDVLADNEADESDALSALAVLICIAHKRNGADLICAITETEAHMVNLWENLQFVPYEGEDG